MGMPVGEVVASPMTHDAWSPARCSSPSRATTSTGTVPTRCSGHRRGRGGGRAGGSTGRHPAAVVDRTRRALADAADAWYDHPSERLQVIGITGTDGKTTTASSRSMLLQPAGRPAGHVGTVAADVWG